MDPPEPRLSGAVRREADEAQETQQPGGSQFGSRTAGNDLVNDLSPSSPRELLIALLANLPADIQWSIDMDIESGTVTRILIGGA